MQWGGRKRPKGLEEKATEKEGGEKGTGGVRRELCIKRVRKARLK